MKLNLGCGTDHMDGYVNIDCNTDVKPDVVASITGEWLAGKYGDLHVDEVVMYSFIEHNRRSVAFEILRATHQILSDGGRIVVKCPNIKKLITSGLPDRWLIGGLYGGQEAECDTHKWGYTPDSLADALALAGFKGYRFESVPKTNDMIISGVK